MNETQETQEEMSTFTQPQGSEIVLGEITLAKVIDSDSNEIRYPCDVKNGRDNLSELDYKMLIYTLATMAGSFKSKGPLQILQESILASVPSEQDAEYFADENDMCEPEEVVLTDEQAEAELAAEETTEGPTAENPSTPDVTVGVNPDGTEFADYSDTTEEADTQEGTMDWSFDK